MIDAETQAKTSRMCDTALEHIQGVADDFGLDEAINVFRAQIAAFLVMAIDETGSKAIAQTLVLSVIIAIVDGFNN